MTPPMSINDYTFASYKDRVALEFVRSGLYPYNLTVSSERDDTARKSGCHRTVRQTAKASQKVHCQ